jgi:hypothetical protein
MKRLRKHPHIYEINLMTWLSELTRREGREINLQNIPKDEWQRFKKMGTIPTSASKKSVTLG